MSMHHSASPPSRPAEHVRRIGGSLVVWGLLWWLLTEGRLESWVVGIPTVIAATYLSQTLAPAAAWHFSVWGSLRFLPLFVRSVLWGASDVAWRSLHPRLPIAPRMILYELQLPSGTGRVFFMNVINLLPGTLSVDIHESVLTVHVVDGRQPMHKRLAALEQAVAAVFALSLSADLAAPEDDLCR